MDKEKDVKQTKDDTIPNTSEATINVIINRARKNKKMPQEKTEEDDKKEEDDKTQEDDEKKEGGEKEYSGPYNIDKMQSLKWDLNSCDPKMGYALPPKFIGLDEDKNKIFKLPPCEIL